MKSKRDLTRDIYVLKEWIDGYEYVLKTENKIKDRGPNVIKSMDRLSVLKYALSLLEDQQESELLR